MNPKRKRGRRETEASSGEGPTRLRHILDIPSSVVSNLCQMELSGNREAIVDGCQGIVEYDENIIVLATNSMNLRFTGRGLQVRVLTHTSAIIEGFITSIEFVS